MAKLCGIYKSSMKAGQLTDALKDLELNKLKVETMVAKLKATVADKESKMPQLVAAIREKNDFLDCTEEYVDHEDDNGELLLAGTNAVEEPINGDDQEDDDDDD